MQYRSEFNNKSTNPFNSIFSILMVILVMIGLFYIARFVFTILYYLSPVMLIAALIIDHKVVVGYGQWIVGLFKKNPLMGIGSVLLTVIGFPVVAVFLLGKAALRKKVREAQEASVQRREGQFIEYEELDSELLDLPELQQEERKDNKEDKGKGYEQLFED